jgi:hypothetical protein
MGPEWSPQGLPAPESLGRLRQRAKCIEPAANLVPAGRNLTLELHPQTRKRPEKERGRHPLRAPENGQGDRDVVARRKLKAQPVQRAHFGGGQFIAGHRRLLVGSRFFSSVAWVQKLLPPSAAIATLIYAAPPKERSDD